MCVCECVSVSMCVCVSDNAIVLFGYEKWVLDITGCLHPPSPWLNIKWGGKVVHRGHNI